MSRWTALQHLLQTAVLALVVAAGAALLLTGYRFVLEPVSQLKRAIERLQGGDFGTRIRRSSNDEFGTLANGFNELAEHLQSMYRNLEAKVAEKTAQLQEKGERLQALYDVSTLITGATTLEALANGFTQRIARWRMPTRWRCAGRTKATSATCCWPARACRRAWSNTSNACRPATAIAARRWPRPACA